MTSPGSLLVDVQIACEAAGMPTVKSVEKWIRRSITASAKKLDGPHEVSVRVVDRVEMRELNRDFRQQDRATNVLSFPAATISGLPADAAQALGDIVLCAEIVCDEAAGQGKSVDDHWAHMLVHGTLHLLGYDHQVDEDAVEMEALEVKILSDHGVSDPYATSC